MACTDFERIQLGCRLLLVLASHQDHSLREFNWQVNAIALSKGACEKL